MNNTIITGIGGLPSMPSAPSAPAGSSGEQGGFGETLRNAIHSVDQLNQTSDSQVGELLKGDRQDIHNVMIAVEKADVSFQLMMQVRNKILNAYQEVSKLQF
ncbi:MAG TPA: flagellar hook-basal body complex protein FliE [Terriglobales bacterium]|nr:flagellar hook-basal body complex protein FliE [Terriglobales bacterium]